MVVVLPIWLSHTPPMLFDSGGFLYHSRTGNHYLDAILLKGTSELCWLEPLSDLIIPISPLHPTNLLKLMMNESVLRECTTSLCIALLGRQVHTTPYILTSFWPPFTTNNPIKSAPQFVSGDFSLILSLVKSAIFVTEIFLSTDCTWRTSIIDLAKKLHLSTQKQEDQVRISRIQDLAYKYMLCKF